MRKKRNRWSFLEDYNEKERKNVDFLFLFSFRYAELIFAENFQVFFLRNFLKIREILGKILKILKIFFCKFLKNS